jgi:hypothetical protein
VGAVPIVERVGRVEPPVGLGSECVVLLDRQCAYLDIIDDDFNVLSLQGCNCLSVEKWIRLGLSCTVITCQHLPCAEDRRSAIARIPAGGAQLILIGLRRTGPVLGDRPVSFR